MIFVVYHSFTFIEYYNIIVVSVKTLWFNTLDFKDCHLKLTFEYCSWNCNAHNFYETAGDAHARLGCQGYLFYCFGMCINQ